MPNPTVIGITAQESGSTSVLLAGVGLLARRPNLPMTRAATTQRASLLPREGRYGPRLIYNNAWTGDSEHQPAERTYDQGMK